MTSSCLVNEYLVYTVAARYAASPSCSVAWAAWVTSVTWAAWAAAYVVAPSCYNSCYYWAPSSWGYKDCPSFAFTCGCITAELGRSASGG